MLAVSPKRQGSGLGPALVAAGEAHLRARGVRRLEIEVINLREPLFAFYSRLGYEVTGERPFEDPRLLRPCHLVVMEKSLAAQDPASRPPA
jgi:ribosomal protein S18 acetylase RimI-like enzyme